MPLLLFIEPLLERIHQFFPTTEFFYLGHLFRRQELLCNSPKPIGRDFSTLLSKTRRYSLENLGKDLIKSVDQPFVFHIGGARQIIEFLGRAVDHLAVEGLEQHEMLFKARGNARCAQLVEKVEKHDDGGAPSQRSVQSFS